jgi:hypothetical protein
MGVLFVTGPAAYLAMGVANIWLIDPLRHVAYPIPPVYARPSVTPLLSMLRNRFAGTYHVNGGGVQTSQRILAHVTL